MTDLAKPPPQRPLLRDAVAERLRDAIVEGELKAGERLNERVLCERLRVSRTPLREAFKVLAAEGLVELAPNRGAVVARFTAETIAQTFAVLGALEALAGRLACANASAADLAELKALHYQMVAHHARGELAPYFHCNQRIHERIVAASGNPVLMAVYRNLNGHMRRARFVANRAPARWDQAMAEHEAILEALVARDAPRLERLLRTHLRHKCQAVLRQGAGAGTGPP